MFTFPESMIVYINFALILWFLINLAQGYKKGLLLQIVDLVGTFVALFAAWVFAPVFVKIFQFVKTPGSGLITVDQIITQQVNKLIWFVILFVVARLLLFLVTPIVSAISKIPFVKQVNSLVGGFFSIVLFVVKLLVLTYFLSFPILSNGQDIIDNTILKPLVEVVKPLASDLDGSLEKNEAIQNIMRNKSLSQDQEYELANWLRAQGINEKDIKGFINSYGQ